MKHPGWLLLLAIIFTAAPRSHAASEGEQKKVKSFNVSKGGTLDVSVNSGDIRVTTWDRNEVNVRVIDLDDEDNDLSITQQGNTVSITDRAGWTNAGSFVISVPSQFHLNVRSSSGNIDVNGKLTGNVTCETAAGDIGLGDVEGTVEGRTSGGDIRAGTITGSGTLNTSGGEIDVAFCTAALDVRSSGGDIRIGNVRKSLRAKTAGGDITIGDVGGEATASTAGGNVRVGKVSGQATLSTSGGDVELAGGNGIIKASTSGGNVVLYNISGSVDAKTSGGDVHVELVPGGKGTSRLVSSAGNIRLYLPENSKATIMARIRIQGGRRSSQETYAIRSDFKEESAQHDKDDRGIESRYVLNGGGETITLETVNSDIEIRKLKK